MAYDKVEELVKHSTLLCGGGPEALIPVIARTCYSIDESGLPKRDTCEGATQAGKSVKGTNFLVNTLKKSLYLCIPYQKKWQQILIPMLTGEVPYAYYPCPAVWS
jgi:hypothetical protein